MIPSILVMLGIVSFWYLGNKTSIKKIRSIDDYVAVATLAKQITGLHPISSLGREHHKCCFESGGQPDQCNAMKLFIHGVSFLVAFPLSL